MVIKTLSADLKPPVFFPDGTVGVVRGVDSRDLDDCRVDGVVVSTFHLLASGIRKDIHGLMNWKGVVLTDSGGFQVFSLLKNNPKSGSVTEEGFQINWGGKKLGLTPEESITIQYNLGADILICLDQCTDPALDFNHQKRAVELTISWARRCKDQFEKLTKNKKRPLLFAVVQGGDDRELRRHCASELIKIGFDGYCYGGWPAKKQNPEDDTPVLLEDILDFTAKLMPDDKYKYALGVGKPSDIIKCHKMGYQIFDTVIPSREARHKRLYLWSSNKGLSYTTLTLNSKSSNKGPVSKYCDCLTCKNYSLAYLYHLFKIQETLAFRLSTIHNLRFYTQLMERLR